MKKILAILTTIILVLPTLGISTLAAGEVTITSPANGSVVENTISTFESTVPVDAVEIVFELDGEIVGTTEGDNSGNASLTTDGFDLYVGKHTLSVYAVMPNGSFCRDRSDFTIVRTKDVYSENLNFDSIEKNDDGTINTDSDPSNWVFNKSGTAQFKIGTDASGGGCMEFHSNTIGGAWKSMYFELQNLHTPYPHNIAVVEFDLKVSSTTNVFAITMFNENGASGVGLGNADSQWNGFLTETGKINGTDVSYGTDWAHVKAEIDYTSSKIKTWYNGILVADRENATIGSQGRLGRMRILSMPKSPSENFVVSLDNLKVYDKYSYSGITSVEVIDDTTVRVNVTDKFDPSLVTDSTVNLMVNGTKQDADVSYEAASNRFILTTASPLAKSARVEAIIDENQNLADGSKTGMASKGFAETAPDVFAIRQPEFISSGNKLISKKQLIAGANIGFQITVDNLSGANKSMLLLMIIRDGNRPISIKASTINATVGTNNYSVNGIIPQADELNIKAVVCDKWSSLNPLTSNVYILK